MEMRKIKRMPIGFMVIAMLLVGFLPISFAAEQSVVAWVTEDSVLETEAGELLEVADTDMGNDLLLHVGKKVEVTGEITSEEGVKVIRVAFYNIIEE
jgi:hypothetical protein